ncbi:hypothetical protein FDUTEX481_05327 [Tolypothrix sp. PCC 7601]|nr:hypothetical protein FDUTEX481_05327 [Tolypothrix sp. PCC 7601]BAY88594.1 hypothetical protein NIES3275_05720 [Microchaete diplosiphon NIES-3275]
MKSFYGASQFGKFIKLKLVIANGAKRNEAIAADGLCDCFASFHYARNDKLYFYTLGYPRFLNLHASSLYW